MENFKNSTTLRVVLWVLLGVALGVCAGYYYGNTAGFTNGKAIGITEGNAQGRAAVLAEQAKVEAEKLKALQEAANPFAEQQNAVNPFKDAYTNPFAN